jgi:DNA-binding protein H-NS
MDFIIDNPPLSERPIGITETVMPRLSSNALKAKIAALQIQLAATENNKAPAIRKVRALMKKLEVTLEDLAAQSPTAKNRKPTRSPTRNAGKKTGAKIPVKYRDEKGNAWTGRGKTPIWIVEAEKAGRSREQFRV